jgi:hypothetical protein
MRESVPARGAATPDLGGRLEEEGLRGSGATSAADAERMRLAEAAASWAKGEGLFPWGSLFDLIGRVERGILHLGPDRTLQDNPERWACRRKEGKAVGSFFVG